MSSVLLQIDGLEGAVYQEMTFFLSGFMNIKGEVVTSSRELISQLGEKRITKFDLLNSELKGKFLLIIQEKNKCTVVTDIVRSKAAFIVSSDNGFTITDDLRTVANKEIDQEQVSRFLGSNCLFGSHNCYKNVYTCQAAEMVTIAKGMIHPKRYFEFIPHSNTRKMTVDQFVGAFNAIMEKLIEQMVESAPEVRNWIVPLSGGHDSRVIVNSLKKAGIQNVICFSYGTLQNPQSKLSKQVADAVGYDWHFVEYTEDKWGSLHKKGLIGDYIDYSFQGVSTPHLQDFLAVFELKKDRILSKEDIFIPGHALDFVAGSHLECIESELNRDQVLYRVGKKFEKFGAKCSSGQILREIYSKFSGSPNQFQEYINWQERQAKFIVNSCRVYEFFGFKYRLPFWNRNFVNFWTTITDEDRKKRNLFKRSEREGILLKNLANIPFEDELNSESMIENSKQKFKKLIPTFLKVFLLRLTGRKQQLAEGMNLIYAQRGNTVEEIIGPIEDFPDNTHSFIKPFLKRYPYQMNGHILSNLYAVRKAYD